MNRNTSSLSLLHKVGKDNKQTKLKQNTSTDINTRTAQRIQKLNDKVILEAFDQHDFKSSSLLLRELENLIEKQDYAANKKYYFYQLYVCYCNWAYCAHQASQPQLCESYLEKAIQNFEIMQAYAKSRQQNITNNIQYVKIMLQTCAILSQNGKHKGAILNAEKSLNKLIQTFRILQAICYEHRLLNTEPQTTQNSLEKEQNKADRVNFKKIVIQEAQIKLSQLSNLPSVHKLLLQDKQHYQGIIKNIYFWKDNSENNQINLRKQFDIQKTVNSPRNILGLQKKSNWIQTFHIGSLMSLKPKKIKFDLNFDTYYLLSPQNILQITIYCSVCYFTIATETRFSQFQQDIDSLTFSQRYKRLHADQIINKCKLLHIKALQIAAKYLPPSNYFLIHLLGSFNKNYKFYLDQIIQKDQMDITIQNMKQQILPLKNQDQLTQYGTINVRNTIVQKKPIRKRSKTNDKLKPKNLSKPKQKN